MAEQLFQMVCLLWIVASVWNLLMFNLCLKRIDKSCEESKQLRAEMDEQIAFWEEETRKSREKRNESRRSKGSSW